jgi:aspartyl protease family protein
MHAAVKTFVLLGAIAALIILVARHGGNVTGLDDGRLVSLVYQIGFLVLVGAGVLRLFRNRLGEAIQAALLWVVVALVLVVAYAYRFELRDARDRIMAELVPGRAVARGQTVEIARAGNGDFQIATEVNGVRVPMLLDTGASSVMLTREAAIAAGLPIEMVRYTITVDTANGRAQAAAVTLDRVAVGGIVERAVPALIAQPGQLKTSLLGMSFLARLQGWEVHGDRILLRGAP